MTIETGPLTPSYLTIDPATGQISASFTGNLTLPESSQVEGQGASPSKVGWTDATGIEEAIWGEDNFPTVRHALKIQAGTLIRTLLTANGSSDFARLRAARDLEFEFQSGVLSAGVGPATYTIALVNTWPNNHLGFFPTVNPASSIAAGNYFIGSAVSDLSHGLIQLASSVAQNWNYTYLSVGN